MSVKIGNIENAAGVKLGEVSASLAGTEIKLVNVDPSILPIGPIQTRNLAALLVRAADEVERMRKRLEANDEGA